jgi:hypothetical protein
MRKKVCIRTKAFFKVVYICKSIVYIRTIFARFCTICPKALKKRFLNKNIFLNGLVRKVYGIYYLCIQTFTKHSV